MTDLDCTWPEQDAIDAWFKKYETNKFGHSEMMELKEAVTAPRLAATDQLRKENEQLRALFIGRRCETTMTTRFQISDCGCGTYPDNLGPCETFSTGADVTRCVYCDHYGECHTKLIHQRQALSHKENP